MLSQVLLKLLRLRLVKACQFCTVLYYMSEISSKIKGDFLLFRVRVAFRVVPVIGSELRLQCIANIVRHDLPQSRPAFSPRDSPPGTLEQEHHQELREVLTQLF